MLRPSARAVDQALFPSSQPHSPRIRVRCLHSSLPYKRIWRLGNYHYLQWALSKPVWPSVVKRCYFYNCRRYLSLLSVSWGSMISSLQTCSMGRVLKKTAIPEGTHTHTHTIHEPSQETVYQINLPRNSRKWTFDLIGGHKKCLVFRNVIHITPSINFAVFTLTRADDGVIEPGSNTATIVRMTPFDSQAFFCYATLLPFKKEFSPSY